MGSVAVEASKSCLFGSLPERMRRNGNGMLRVRRKRCAAMVMMGKDGGNDASGSAGIFRSRWGPNSALKEVWREIQGCNDWCELMEPLHPHLRREIVRYGEFVKASYKGFDFDPNSRSYLNCKYGKKSILRESGLCSSNYDVTKYIYATPDVVDIFTQEKTCSRWVGYVAVSSDTEVKRLGRRDIVVSFRGTMNISEWIVNLMSSLTTAKMNLHHPQPDIKVESGFLNLYTSRNNKLNQGSCREQLLSEIRRLIDLYKDEEVSITLTGHSMGSSLALLFGYDIAELGLNHVGEKSKKKKIPITVYSFAGPRVGNVEFKKRCEELEVKVLRVVNVNDPITKLPGVFFNENFRVFFPWKLKTCFCYAHVGVELSLDFFTMRDPSCVHDLGHMITLLRCPAIERSGESLTDWMNLGQLLLRLKIAIDAAFTICKTVQSLGF
ncbi:Phospholipase A1 [Zostera marina]|uniref:Phospholipase A1 n=1 Tax=Zostera marina TaxID=29655 RepID=A0A0K9P9J7_ZOSMR|nr:Phospholipase A1 [Zostera marina]